MTPLKTIAPAILVIAVALYFATPANAQTQSGVATCGGTSAYRGRCVDIAVVAKEPGAYAECDKPKSAAPGELVACRLGVTDAKTMAKEFAGVHGRMLGFDRGFAAGMYDGEQRALANDLFVAEGERVVDRMDAFMESGLRTVADRGQALGSQDGAQAARSLFDRAVVNGQRGQMPVETMGAMPTPNYLGEDDGYRRYVPQDGDYANLDVRQTLDRMENDYGRYHTAYDRVTAGNRAYIGDYTRLSLRDLWYDDGVYPFDTRHWVDPQIAWRAWSSQSGIPRRQYDSLSHSPPLDLQAVFQRAFADAYGYYANYYFASALYGGMDDGYRQGIVVGAELGHRLARNRGMVRRFNDRFKIRTRSGYEDAYQSAYPAAFHAEFDRYRTHAVISVEVAEVIGAVPDGVLEPGESFKLRLRVVNSGGVSTPLSGSPSGAIDQAIPFQDNIDALTSREFVTGVVGRIDPRLHPGDQADIRMMLNGTAAAPFPVALHRAVQLTPASIFTNLPDGSGTVGVTARNGSTVRTGGDIAVIMTLEGHEFRQTVPALNPGESRAVRFDFSDQDPLPLYGGVFAHVRVQMGDVVMDEQDVRKAVDREGLVLYFAALVRPVASGVFIPAGIDRAQRLADVAARIAGLNQTEVRGARANIWKDAPDSTIVGLVRREFTGMAHNTASAAAFHDLGARLWAERTDLGRFLFFNSAKRSAYERVVKDILRGKP